MSTDTVSIMTTKQRLKQPYLVVVSVVGCLLALFGLIQLPTFSSPLAFGLLLVLAIASQITTTTMIGGEFSVSVSSAVTMAAVGLFGPAGSALIAAGSELGLWIIKIKLDQPDWRGTWPQLTFNMGMNSIAMFLAGLLFNTLQNWLGNNLLGQTIPWLIGALVADQLNLWLVIGIIHLQHNAPPLAVWRQHRWAIPMNVAIMAFGGGLLALAVDNFDILGIIIFFLPIFLSAYTFRLYLRQTRRQMTELETLVTQRTEALAKANEELADLHKEKDDFLAVLTHDMRTPLTSIRGYTTLLRDQPELVAGQEQNIFNTILRNELILTEIVNNILEIEQLESGGIVELNREQVDLGQLLKVATISIQAQAMKKEIVLSCQVPDAPLMLSADKQKLRRVATNLISNAIKYTPIKGQVTVSAVQEGNSFVFAVEDNGYGIPEEDLPYLFERFRRVEKHKSKAVGTGLGLVIVKNLIEAHGGTITVVSEEGKGSLFTVTLPAGFPTTDLG